MVTALYCKILVILGLAFPMAEVISDNVPKGYYQLFYVYLFLGSLLYLLFIYVDLLRTRARTAVMARKALAASTGSVRGRKKKGKDGEEATGNVVDLTPRPRVHYGSFYLRLGAVCMYNFPVFHERTAPSII